jgi:hypothetical protein
MSITVCLLNWKRVENLEQIINSLVSQTVKPKIFLWNNSLIPTCQEYSRKLDWYIQSTINKICWPRWFMASQADTEYVMSLDDDLCLRDNKVLEYILNNITSDRLYGMEGVALQSNKLYGQSLKAELPDIDDKLKACDIVKGKLAVLSTELLKSIPNPNNIIDDDIYLSSKVANGRRLYNRVLKHISITRMTDNKGLCNDINHYIRRDETTRKYFYEDICRNGT